MPTSSVSPARAPSGHAAASAGAFRGTTSPRRGPGACRSRAGPRGNSAARRATCYRSTTRCPSCGGSPGRASSGDCRLCCIIDAGMRWGVISDVHANVHALDAVLRALRRESVDAILCAGDVVGYGPHPNECVERLASLDPQPVAIAGNHDLMAIGRLRTDGIAPLARQTIAWTTHAPPAAAAREPEGPPRAGVTRAREGGAREDGGG